MEKCQRAPPPTKVGIINTIPMPRSLASIGKSPIYYFLRSFGNIMPLARYHKIIFIAIFLYISIITIRRSILRVNDSGATGACN
jgi:hypothetical protein